jgi:hypothetical protein
MERAVVHYHVDVFDTKSHPLWSSQAMPKSAAKREFERLVNEYRQQVGKFTIRPATEKRQGEWVCWCNQVSSQPQVSHCADEMRLRLGISGRDGEAGSGGEILSAEEVHVL